MGVRIGIDTGGTFTDLVVMDEATGLVDVVKLPSTPDEPSRAILAALEQAGIDPANATYLVLGTTVAVNALLQRRGARVLYITTEGFEDVPFLQRVSRKFHYDLDWERPLPLVVRRDCLGIPERVDYKGATVTALTAEGTEDLIASIRERLAVADGEPADVAFALNFLFSYVRPDHEASVRKALTKAFPGIPISASHEVAPIWREYERASTTIADAAVKPLVSRFIGSLDAGLRERGFARSWSVMKSNGGQMLAETAGERPVQTVLSGLSGGIIAGQAFGADAGASNVITFDMGGTSTDVGVVANDRIRYTTAWEIEFGLPVAAPFIEMTTMGAGGGSIAWVNKGGLLQVGPQSAGAVPGPACYSQGGEEATVTDANVVLGRLNPDNFLGGDLPLDADLAFRAIERTARDVGLPPVDTAHAVVEIAVENIAEAMRLLTVQRGLDPRVFSLVAFGGAGPLHAAAIARVIGTQATLIPPHPGLCSAFGTLLADIRVDKTWTHLVRSDSPDLADLDVRLNGLVREAVEDLGREGFEGAPAIHRSANMRYLGQNYEEEIPIPDGPLSQDAWQALIDGFEQHYEAEYGYRIANEVIEVVQLSVSAVGAASKPQLSPLPERPPAAPRAKRRVYFDPREPVACPVFERSDLSPADVIQGPAVIEELDSTTLVHPGQTLTVGSRGLASLVWA
ncbi:MAG: hydantoinase/oxoprolinase family protein [Chloroflexota bacterium]|nr:hydantoinase/oxoprolinase family protein [Chloroflexota bacterium]